MSGVGGAGGNTSINTTNIFKSRILAGVTSMAASAQTFVVNFPDVGINTYSVDVTVQNLVDATARHLIGTVIQKKTNSFTFQTPQTTDSANYKVNWIIDLDAITDYVASALPEVPVFEG